VSLLFFEHQGSDLLRVKGVVIRNTGHLLTSYLTNINTVSFISKALFWPFTAVNGIQVFITC
jgi:hypothetical protein